jgi:VanZ family protein
MNQRPPHPPFPKTFPFGGLPRLLLPRLALALCLVSIAVLAFAPLSVDPGTGNDKINHLLAFAVLAALADGSFPGQGWAKWATLLGYGLTIEAVQIFLPYREASGWDLLADGAGIGLYVAGARLVAALRAGRTRSAISAVRPRKGA